MAGCWFHSKQSSLPFRLCDLAQPAVNLVLTPTMSNPIAGHGLNRFQAGDLHHNLRRIGRAAVRKFQIAQRCEEGNTTA